MRNFRKGLYFLCFPIVGLLLLECNRTTNAEVKRYCSYSKYEDIKINDPQRTEVILKVIYEEWESDSMLFVYYYTDTVLNAYEIIDEPSIFQNLESRKTKFKYGYRLNFSSNILPGQYNLIDEKSVETSEYNRDSMYVFIYYPEVDEDDMNSIVFYNPNFGVIADYSYSWNNLILLDSIYNREEVGLYKLTNRIIKDSLLNHYTMRELN